MFYLPSDLQIMYILGITEHDEPTVCADIDDHMLMGEQKCWLFLFIKKLFI